MNLLDVAAFNGVITMILVTCILSPILIERYGSRLSATEFDSQGEDQTDRVAIPIFDRILIPVSNPSTEVYLFELASILSHASGGLLMPINVAKLNNGQVEGLSKQRQLLESVALSNTDIDIQPIHRIDASVSNGILSATIEHDASSIIMGWSGETAFHKTIFGRMLDEVIWSAHVPILVGRLTSPISTKQRVILVIPKNSLSPQLVKESIDTAIIIAQAIKVPLKVLTTSQFIDDVSQMKELLNFSFTVEEIDRDLVREVAEKVDTLDLVIIATFGSQRRFQSSLGRIPEELAGIITASLVVMRFPFQTVS